MKINLIRHFLTLSFILCHLTLYAQSIIQKHFSGGVFESSTSIDVLPDKGYLISGYTESYTTDRSGLLSRVDSLGNLLWTNIYNEGVQGFNCQIDKVKLLANGNYFISAVSLSPSIAITWIAVLDSSGVPLFSKNITAQYPSRIYINDFIENDSNSITICGYIDYGPNPIYRRKNMFLMKMSQDLNAIWTKEYSFRFDNQIISIDRTVNQEYILQAYSWDTIPPSREDILILKIDSSGNLIYAKKCGDIPPASVINSSATGGIIRYLPNGTIINVFSNNWFNNPSFENLILQKLDINGMVLLTKSITAGFTHDFFNGSNNDFYLSNGLQLMNVDSTFNINWKKRLINYQSPINNIGQPRIKKASNGGIAVTGGCNLISKHAIYFGLIDSSGHIGCEDLSIPYSNPISQSMPTVDITSNILAIPVIISDTSIAKTYTPINLSDSTYCNTNTNLNNIHGSNEVSIFPNPCTNHLLILGSTALNLNYKIYDLSGRIIKSGIFVDGFLDVSSMINGIYFIKVNFHKDWITLKFIKYND